MDENKTKVTGLGLLEKLAQDFKGKLDATNGQVEALAAAGGEPNVITAVTVNGAAVAITDKAVDITVPTAVSDLTNDSGYQTGEQVESAINAKVSSTYKAGGSVAFADLPALEAANLGLVVNVTDKFTTTEDFLEGAGSKHPAGTNVAVVQVGDAYKYDVMAGFVDLSGYDTTEQADTKLAGKVDKEEGMGLSSNDFTDELKTKLDGIEYATEDDYNAMIARVFGTGSEG